MGCGGELLRAGAPSVDDGQNIIHINPAIECCITARIGTIEGGNHSKNVINVDVARLIKISRAGSANRPKSSSPVCCGLIAFA